MINLKYFTNLNDVTDYYRENSILGFRPLIPLNTPQAVQAQPELVDVETLVRLVGTTSPNLQFTQSPSRQLSNPPQNVDRLNASA